VLNLSTCISLSIVRHLFEYSVVKSLVKQQENIMSLTSVLILITFFLDDVWLLLGETGSWSLSCLEKMMLCMLPGVLFMPLATKCCFSLCFQHFKFFLALLFFVVVMLSLTYVFLIFLLLFSLCHLILFNKYTQNLSLSVLFSI